jgi:FkbM family methyltransferase
VGPRGRYLKNCIWPARTFAQQHEDEVAALLLGRVERFIDIGAFDGVSGSNSFLFALRGASGLCFEPELETYRQLRKLYTFNRKVSCINQAVGPQARDDLTMMVPSGSIGPAYSYVECDVARELFELRGLDDEHVRASRRSISMAPLQDWLVKFPAFREVDLVSLDVEGYECEVLESLPWGEFSCRCWIVETHRGYGALARQPLVRDLYRRIDGILVAAGYRAVLQNAVNTFWLPATAACGRDLRAIAEAFDGYQVVT